MFDDLPKPKEFARIDRILTALIWFGICLALIGLLVLLAWWLA